MNLQYLDVIYKNMFQGVFISPFITYSKVLGCLIIVIVMSNNLFRSFSRTGIIFTPRESDGFSPYDLLRGAGLILLVTFSTQILNVFDSLMVDVETLFFAEMEQLGTDYRVSFFPSTDKLTALFKETEEKRNGWDIVKGVLDILSFLNPFTWLGGAANYLLSGLLNGIDMFIYPFFLCKRYFIMGILKFMFPLMIALSIFNKTRDFIIIVLKYYARIYLAIIPMVFTTIFTAIVFQSMHDILDAGNVMDHLNMAIGGPLITCCILIFTVILKTKLYSESFKIMDKLIP